MDSSLEFEIPLILVAVAVNGVLAGISSQRSLVELPAWSKINLAKFQDYSRAADLDHGIVLYPVLGVSAAGLVFAATIIGIMSGYSFSQIIFLYVSTILSILHSFATSQAAPNMLSFRNKSISELQVKQKFDAFRKWSDRRATLQLLTFLCLLLSLAVLIRRG